MSRKLLAVLCVFVFAVVPVKSEASSPVRLGVLTFSSPHELVEEADSITRSFRNNLAGSKSIAVTSRTNADYDAHITDDIEAVSALGRSESCSYMLIGSVNTDKDIVITARIVDVSSARVTFAVSETCGSSDIDASVLKLSGRISEYLSGSYPGVSDVKGREVYINRGSSSGIKKGDLFRVYEEYHEVLDVNGNSTGRETVDLAVIEVRKVQKDSGTAVLMKNGGDTRIIPRLKGNRIEAVSKSEARRLIRQGALTMKSVERKTRGAVFDASFTMKPDSSDKEKNKLTAKLKEAEAGYPKAQAWVGIYYFEHRDFPLALKWLQEAEAQGNMTARNWLSYMYKYGLGVPQNYAKAFELELINAGLGDPTAQVEVGNYYHKGRGVEKDPHKAFLWFERSAKQGNDEGLEYLAMCYVLAEGVDQDFDKAIDLYTQSAAKGNWNAKYHLGVVYTILTEDAGKKEKQRYLKLAREWFMKALEQSKHEGNNGAVKVVEAELDKLN